MERTLKKYAVRIKEGESVIGSGVLWRPQENEGNKLYIFSAAHVLKDAENVTVEFWKNENLVQIPVDQKQITISDTYKNSGDFGDVGIIVLEYPYEELDSYKFADFSRGSGSAILTNNLSMVGFPKEGQVGDSFELSWDELKLEYIDFSAERFTVKYRVGSNSINAADRNSELEGFSGSGVFCEIGSDLILIGIHKCGPGSDSARGNLLGTTSEFIRNMCLQHQFDVPPVVGEINGNLSDQQSYIQEEILEALDGDDFDRILSVITEICGQDMTNAIRGNFYNYCEECPHRSGYYSCKYFRGYLLVLAIFLKIVNEAVDLEAPCIEPTGDIPIYFVCSEGKGRNSQSKLKMSHFIHAMKSQTELAHKLKNDCIIVWGSQDPAKKGEEKCTSSGYRSILQDITKRSALPLDITTLYKDPRPRAIIRIDEIADMLSQGKLHQLHDRFLEYIKELDQ